VTDQTGHPRDAPDPGAGPSASAEQRPNPEHDRRPNGNLARGRAGEDLAAAWYVGQGYDIVARNWRNRRGEIDLVCARRDLIVFCEVKSRRTDRHGAPPEAVTRRKQLRLRRLAADYLVGHANGRRQVRFDVAAILGTTLSVIEDAF
jgi:putative endonuclease